jgi:hypothetical protein
MRGEASRNYEIATQMAFRFGIGGVAWRGAACIRSGSGAVESTAAFWWLAQIRSEQSPGE